MNEKRINWAIAGAIAALYLVTVVSGLHIKSLRLFYAPEASKRKLPWHPPEKGSIPAGEEGENIRRGMQIFNDTSLYAPHYTQARVNCGSCHADGGIQPYAAPMVGATGHFPMYSKRAGHVISLYDRIEECFVRSENGRPVPHDAPEMKALVDYIGWLSTPQRNNLPFSGSGLALLEELKPDAKRGERIFGEQCAGCHGAHGEGSAPTYPPLWGPDSFNDGAGMYNVRKLASFVQHNMPQNRMGSLTPQEAFDVAAFIHRQPRPHFDEAFSEY